jgi:branched-chain amino acid transport system permease protein
MSALATLRDARARSRDGFGRLAERWHAAPKALRWLAGAVGIALVYMLPSYGAHIPLLETPGSDFATVLFYPVGIYVLMAVGLNVVVGQAGLLDLGYVAFFGVGAYSMAYLSTRQDLDWPVILPIGIAFAIASGVVLGTPTLRLRGDYLAIVTLGFGEIVRIVGTNTDSLGGPGGIPRIPRPPDFLGIEFTVLDPKPFYWLLVTMIILTIFCVRRLERSRVGRAWIAIREDEDAAELMGVPTFRFKLWAFAIGAAVGGAGGTLYATKASFINPATFPLYLSILFLACVVLGGSGNLVGVIVGAALVGYLPERFRGFEDKRVLVFGLALVAMMIFRPQGIIPSKRRAGELADTGMGPLADDTTSDEELEGEMLSEPFGPART